jgi:hypothetical protein
VSAKSLLLSVIADANGCRVVMHAGTDQCTAIGFEAELDAVELLYTSLRVQATNAMVVAGSQVDARGRSRTRSFRQSFLVAFASRIGERLTQAVEVAVAEATATHGAGVLPVLASRERAVADAVRDAYPGLRTSRLRAGNPAGARAGVIAADQADLAVAPGLRRRAG